MSGIFIKGSKEFSLYLKLKNIILKLKYIKRYSNSFKRDSKVMAQRGTSNINSGNNLAVFQSSEK